MLLDSSGMLLAELPGMLSLLSSVLPMSKGMLSPAGILLAGMLIAEVAGMLRKAFSMLLISPSMLPIFEGMLPASVSVILKNFASAAFYATHASYPKR
jgi:hypothetical protein